MESKRYIIENFSLPVDLRTWQLLSANSTIDEEINLNDVVLPKIEQEYSFLDKIAINFTNQNNEGNSIPIHTDIIDTKKKTRIYIVEGDQESIFSKLKELSISPLIMNKEKELFSQSESDSKFYNFHSNPLTQPDSIKGLNKDLSDNKNIIYIKTKDDGAKLLREVEELSESVTSCEKLKGHPCSISHKYNKATRRMNKVITCNYEGCGKQFTKSWNILDHFKVHTGDRPFVCETWGRAFSQKGNLSKHKKLHTERKYFEFDF